MTTINTGVEGVIYKGVGGFYYVQGQNGVLYECRARGIFRNRGIKPVPGDRVTLLTEAGTVYIEEILPRKNVFVRPPVANVDVFFVLASTVQPAPSYFVIDKLTAVALENEAQPVIVVTKADLAAPDELLEVYAGSGIPIFVASGEGLNLDKIRGWVAGRLCIFCGNSGVGKSTLLNALLPAALRETGAISLKLGRGRHTTREVEIFEVGGGLLADTPGFASFDVQRASPIIKENLQFDFPEIESRMAQCRYTGCSHVAEDGCAVREAVAAGQMAQSRYESYVALYEGAKQAQQY